ncbi:TPA: hypothetical protein DDW69_00275 [candidate division CPR2 bacterium]|uniref:Uncharacterized protein n=1 Tax=candidate division CPR2 bacterium GW2011_GWC1_41_48 TaxID=1618344 RepID=A0A0G0W6V9_UNCC2|nr:MAG: hypothetical protein UT47_C0005G0015 [candidate division CPR2 bacterium GW2011_GWC2_39_35]KKR28182.1 MAG: hypothetical protein UT60_C0026G0013 [candidate division CPR2 bacterium GW2011_GWD2_39_7]KKS08704.1 MAG: hypothetical protein UU65_C0005G0015 [candidate division CPR2 bacterium GW2011_GWC1_41_48]OGB72292.1 MAG: hypothetical protein A2Y26_03510 [candidate division CPR2 bacterium GWD2_39_7]HBG81259.1 hypothetical protein [candidate division CPR2 bacterium]
MAQNRPYRPKSKSSYKPKRSSNYRPKKSGSYKKSSNYKGGYKGGRRQPSGGCVVFAFVIVLPAIAYFIS